MALKFLAVFCLGAARIQAEASKSTTASGANPIRKVVTLMQNMQKEIEAEGVKEKDLFDKFMCFCGSSSGDLEKAQADSEAKIEELTSKISGGKAEKNQLGLDLVQHKKDRSDAQADLAQAISLREKEVREFTDMSGDSKTNIDAMGGAVTSLEAGMDGAALLQLPHRTRIHRLVENCPSIDGVDRRNVIAFLDQSGDFVPQSGQIVGILKQMKDEMESDLKQATGDEKQASATFNELKASKESEIKLATTAIENKMARSGNLAVELAQTKNALEDEQDALADAQTFQANLGEQCKTKQQEWDARVKSRNDELAAISEAIEILSGDDAMETFKKTLPSPSLVETQPGLGFLQRSARHASPLTKAKALMATVAGKQTGPEFGLMLLTMNSKLKLLSGRRASEGEDAPQSDAEALQVVTKIVDGMLKTLVKQQTDDDKQNDWCKAEFLKADDSLRDAKEKVASLEAFVSELNDNIAQLDDEIVPIKEAVVSLDRSVAEATEQRKKEHAEYYENQQMNSIAEKLVAKALNRMRQFYAPELHKKTTTAAPSAEEQALTAGADFLQVSARKNFLEEYERVAPPQAPETFSGAPKKNKKSGGILAMMDDIIQDLKLQTQEATGDENYAQKSYAKLMQESQETRAQHSKSITDKQAAKAVLETKLQNSKQSHRDAGKDLSVVQAFLNDLHMQCDFLVENYESRKASRAEEVASLEESKALVGGTQEKHQAAQVEAMGGGAAAEGEGGEAAAPAE